MALVSRNTSVLGLNTSVKKMLFGWPLGWGGLNLKKIGVELGPLERTELYWLHWGEPIKTMGLGLTLGNKSVLMC
jgi:hypothetical protein